MADFQERITEETEPSIRVEHDVRYAAVATLVATSPAWVDLGCGTGLAAGAAIEQGRPPKVTFVDIDETAAGEAARALGGEATALAADLSSGDGLAMVRAVVCEGTIVTCFETMEHLPAFAPLLELLVELSATHGITVVMSVPNDAFSGIENPHHVTVWGEGAVEELRGLLPAGYVIAQQLALAGSVIAIDEATRDHAVAVTARAAGAAATHFIVAFGPRAGELAGTAAVAQVDQRRQRAWERQRSADRAFYRRMHLLVDVYVRERDEYRSYIHDLEGRLGLPPSGVEDSDVAGPVA